MLVKINFIALLALFSSSLLFAMNQSPLINESLQIDTDTLTFRFIEKHDFSLFYELYSDKEVQKYWGPGTPRDEEWCTTAFSTFLNNEFTYSPEKYPYGVAIVVESKKYNESIGIFIVKYLETYPNFVTLGVLIKQKYWGQKIGSKSASFLFEKILLPFFRNNDQKSVTHFFTTASPENKASLKISDKLGFINPKLESEDLSPESGFWTGGQWGLKQVYWFKI